MYAISSVYASIMTHNALQRLKTVTALSMTLQSSQNAQGYIMTMYMEEQEVHFPVQYTHTCTHTHTYTLNH